MTADSDIGVRYRVSHRTAYEYSQPMTDGYTVAHILPRTTAYQSVEHTAITVDPPADERQEHTDLFGNRVLQVGIHHQHRALTVEASSEVTVSPAPAVGDGPPWESVAAAVADCRGEDALDVRPFAGGVPMANDPDGRAALASLVATSFTRERPIVDAARQLCHDIFTGFVYDRTFTDVSTPLSTVLDARRGVCQDFAHLAVNGLRLLGLSARYVSGYLDTSVPGATPSIAAADASHAWCALWVPGPGWIDFDPTNDQLPATGHITVAWGRDYGDVAPMRGVVIGPQAVQTLTVSVSVTRL